MIRPIAALWTLPVSVSADRPDGRIAEIPPLAALGIGMTVNGDELLLDSRRLWAAFGVIPKEPSDSRLTPFAQDYISRLRNPSGLSDQDRSSVRPMGAGLGSLDD